MVATRYGVALAWGRNQLGQLGTGDTTDRTVPAEVKGSAGLRFIQVASGGEHSMGLTVLGQVYVWGELRAWIALVL